MRQDKSTSAFQNIDLSYDFSQMEKEDKKYLKKINSLLKSVRKERKNPSSESCGLTGNRKDFQLK